jgi:hypothetical protein
MLRMFRVFVVLIALAVVGVVVAACSREEGPPSNPAPSGDPSGAEATKGAEGGPLPCFPEAAGMDDDRKSELALRVEGVPVPKETVDRFARIWQMRRPHLTEATRLRSAIEEGIIPVAAVYATYRHELPALSERAWKAWRRLEKGEPWNDVVLAESDDPNRVATSKSSGTAGIIGEFRRLETGAPPAGNVVEDVGFSIPIDTYSRPCVTTLGIQIVHVQQEKPGASPGETTREFYRILFCWDEEYGRFVRDYPVKDPDAEARLHAFKDRFRRVIEQARVTDVHPDYRGSIYPFRMKGP